jgi:hypothetical protein
VIKVAAAFAAPAFLTGEIAVAFTIILFDSPNRPGAFGSFSFLPNGFFQNLERFVKALEKILQVIGE